VTTIDVNGTVVNYRIDGASDGPVVALCHSLGTSLHLWDRQIEAWAPSYRILRYDLRGHGQTSIPPGPCSVETLAADFLGLLDALDIERVDFCGVSIGGLIGQWVGVHAPTRVRRLVLANTAARIGTVDTWDARIAAVLRSGLSVIAQGAMERAFTAPFIAREPGVVAAFQQTLTNMSPEGYASCCAAIRDADLRSLAPDIAQPTLVVAGEHDPVTTPDDARWLAEHIPNATMMTLPAAHLSNVEASAQFNAAAQAFFSDIGGLT
jgi:3-oxoadipate enol-lactonase